MEIRVGTSGWSFADWVGVYYPYKLKKTDWIRFYARDFRVSEINSTYYRIGPPRTFDALVQRTPDEFEFFVKLNADVTHKRKDVSSSMKALRECTMPLRDSKKLKGYVAQFPSAFKQTAETQDYLLHVRNLAGDIPLFVEFRHESWWKEEVFDFFRHAGLHYISVDEPKLPGLMISGVRLSRDILYMRFHGRNVAAWWDQSKGDRYDYLYSDTELEHFGETVLGVKKKAKRVYLFFNNCHAGHAIRNAKWLQLWLAQRTGQALKPETDDDIFSP